MLGFAAISSAAPHLNSRFEEHAAIKREAIMPAERGLTWTPKKRQSSINQIASVTDISIQQDFSSFSKQTVVIINQLAANILQLQQILLEQELVALVQEQLFLLQLQNSIVDNIRKNHFKNKNSNVNTIIVIVQQVSDNRGGNQKNRYMTRQIQSNSNVQEQVVVIIQEQNTIQVGGSGSNSNSNSNSNGASPTGSSSAAQSTASVSAAANATAIGTYQPDLAQFPGYTPNIDLLPADLQQAPQFNFGSQGADPAIIIQANQAVFVEFNDQSQKAQDQSTASAEIITVVSGGGGNII